MQSRYLSNNKIFNYYFLVYHLAALRSSDHRNRTKKRFYKTETKLEAPLLGIILKDSQGIPMVGVNNKHYVGNLTSHPVSEGYVSMAIPYLTFFEGMYHVDIHFGNAFQDIEVLRDCFQIVVEPMKFTTTGEMPDKKINRSFIKDISWVLDAK